MRGCLDSVMYDVAVLFEHELEYRLIKPNNEAK